MSPLRVVALACVMSAGARAGAAAAAANGPPNFLVLVADDLGYETLGAYGGLDYRTPRLDRLAAGGMRFARAYASPVCTPSRMSIYTGAYVSRHGYDRVLPVHRGTRERVPMGDRWQTYAHRLRDRGYATTVTGKWQLAALEYHPDHCRSSGFDAWCVWQIWRDDAKTTRYWRPCLNQDGVIRDDLDQRFGPDVLADYTIERMRSAVAAGRPFCVHHNFLLPHVPIVATPDDRLAGRAGSLGRMIAYLDKLCGRLLDAVDQLGVADETYVLFVGDNGTQSDGAPRTTAAGPVSGGKWDLNDAGTHVPLIVRGPGVPAGVSHGLVDVADLAPTIDDLAGSAASEGAPIDGRSLAPLWRGEPGPPRRVTTAGQRGRLSVFDGAWRLTTKPEELLDARRLPHERPVEADDADPDAAGARERLRSAIGGLPARSQ